MNAKKILLSVFTLLVPALMFAQDRISKHSKELQLIIKSDEKGVIRGYDFGTTLAEIKATETGEPQGEGKDFIAYRVTINANEYAEIIYTLDEEHKITAFTIAFVENVNAALEEVVIDDFQSYFNERYGKNTINDKNNEVWNASEGYVIEMGDASESTGDLLEIEIEIYKK